MIRIALTFTLLLSLLSAYASCNETTSYSCESYSDMPFNDGFYLNPWSRYEGNYSCISWSNGYKYVEFDQTTITNGMQLEINLKTNSSAEFDIYIETTNGTIRHQRIRNHIVYDGADGNRWHWHTYRTTFTSLIGETITGIRMRVPRFYSIDDISIDVSGGTGSGGINHYLKLINQTAFQYTLTEDDLFNPQAKQWQMKLEGLLAANDEAQLILTPQSIDTDFFPSCEDILNSQINVDSSEAGGDSFSIECESGTGAFDSSKLFLKIKNNTAKTYCSPIEFDITTSFNIEISDTIESTTFSEVFDIITNFK